MLKVILPAFYPPVNIVRHVDDGERLTVSLLCERAGVACRVTGQAAQRPVIIKKTGAGVALTRLPGDFGAMHIACHNTDPRFILGAMAYGFNDYAARESVRDLGLFGIAPPKGRPRTGRALSGARRTRRSRARSGTHSPPSATPERPF